MKLSSLIIALSFATLVQGETLPSLELDQAVIQRLGIASTALEKHIVADPVVASAQLTIDPARTHSVASFFPGQIETDLVQIGDQVTAGQELARLRSREVAGVLSAFLETSAKLESARLLYERERSLLGKKLTTEESFLTAKAAFFEAEASRQAARQEALLARSPEVLDQLAEQDSTEDLTRLPITTPMAGVVIEKSALRGTAIETNQELFQIADLSRLVLDIKVPLKAAALMKKDDTITFQTVVGEARSGEATIAYLSPVVRESSLTRRILAFVDNPDTTWLPGTPVTVNVIDKSAPQVLAAPSGSIVLIEGKPHLFVEQSKGNFRPVPVTLGRHSQDFSEISAGLKDGTKIVSTGASLLLAAWEEHSAE